MTLFDHYISLGKAVKLGAALIFAKRSGIGGKSAPIYLDIGAGAGSHERGGSPPGWA